MFKKSKLNDDELDVLDMINESTYDPHIVEELNNLQELKQKEHKEQNKD